MFYGSDTHAEAAAAIFSVIASCRLHRLDPFSYLEEILRILPYWPADRYLELAPKHWQATRGRLRPEELAAPLSAFEIPPADPAPPRARPPVGGLTVSPHPSTGSIVVQRGVGTAFTIRCLVTAVLGCRSAIRAPRPRGETPLRRPPAKR